MAQGDLVQRMLGAATLNIDTFEEVQQDTTATAQAAAVVVLVAGVIAIRQALDFSTGKAILTAIFGWMALFVPVMLLLAFAVLSG
jgi:cytochrome bd-type quinol oxidase subunit 2